MSARLKAKFFRGLADPSRLKVLETLQGRPHCVSELLEITRLSQPNLSMHLACLRKCGLVDARRSGRFVYYELSDQAVPRLLNIAGQVLGRVGKRIEVCPRYEVGKKENDTRTRTKSKLRVRVG